MNLYILLFCKRRQHFPKINIEASVWLRFKGWILTKILQFKFFPEKHKDHDNSADPDANAILQLFIATSRVLRTQLRRK